MLSEYITYLLESATSHVTWNNLQNSERCPISRAGSKTRLARYILPYFPSHYGYIEPFFGAGGMFLQIPEEKLAFRNVLNDLDGDIINLFTVFSKVETVEVFLERLLGWVDCDANWRYANRYQGDDPVERAVCYYIKINRAFKGMSGAFEKAFEDTTCIATRLKRCHNLAVSKHLTRATFRNQDFRDFFVNFVYKGNSAEKIRLTNARTLVYADPPYIGTDAGRHYDSKSWSLDDLNDLIEILSTKGFENFIISERLTKETQDMAKKWGLKIITLPNDATSSFRKRQEILIVSDSVHGANLLNNTFDF